MPNRVTPVGAQSGRLAPGGQAYGISSQIGITISVTKGLDTWMHNIELGVGGQYAGYAVWQGGCYHGCYVEKGCNYTGHSVYGC